VPRAWAADDREALFALGTGSVAGWSRFSADHALPGEIEIGWTFLGRAYWGGAYNLDMKRLKIAHAFRFVDRVIFRIGAGNVRSRRQSRSWARGSPNERRQSRRGDANGRT